MYSFDINEQVRLERIMADNGVVRYDIIYINPYTLEWHSKNKRTIKTWDHNEKYDAAVNSIINICESAPIDFLSKHFMNNPDEKGWYKEKETAENDCENCRNIVCNEWVEVQLNENTDTALFTRNELDLSKKSDIDKFHFMQNKICDYLFKETDIKGVYLCPSFMCYQNIRMLTSYIIVISTKKININLVSHISNFSSSYASKEVVGIISQIIKQENVKSTIAAIMSRNMSHNLGSHFISNTKNYFGKYIKTEAFEKYEKYAPDNSEKLSQDLRGIRHVLQYTQERMDYIATIVSGDQYPLGALNVKAQFFDELTVNNFAARHKNKTTNFFLKYLVFSEKYSIDNGEQKPAGFQNIALQIKYDGETFTGKPNGETNNNEDIIKTKLSQLNFAVPGGVMARHALFNIVENVMRNSAKHSKIDKDEGLVFTLEIERLGKLNEEQKKVVKKKYHDKSNLLKVRIYDNKGNGSSVQKEVKERMSQIHTLNISGNMNKENKGLKEMLICILWLQNEDISKVLMAIDSAANETERYSIIEKYLRVIEQDDNLGYEFELPEFEKIHTLKQDELHAGKIIEICADIVRFPIDDVQIINGKNEKENKKLSEIFPRFSFFTDKDISDDKLEELFKSDNKEVFANYYNKLFESVSVKVLRKKLSDYSLYIDGKEESGAFGNRIVFENHLDNDDKDSKKKKYNEIYKNAVYVDSISGGNFTKTITSDDFLKDKLQKNKLIESALTKIAIIDERIFEKVCAKNAMTVTVEELLYDTTINNATDFFNEVEDVNVEIRPYKEKIKNISIEEYGTEDGKDKIRKILRKEEIEETIFRRKNIFLYDIEKDGIINLSKNKCGSINPSSLNDDEKNKFGNEVHFLSIHLGLLENLMAARKKTCKGLKINHLMDEIKKEFDAKFIVIHSGRGNFSADLEDDLKDYPFISLSALEAAFDNSKYFLSQLFYNTIYYGKGNFNN